MLILGIFVHRRLVHRYSVRLLDHGAVLLLLSSERTQQLNLEKLEKNQHVNLRISPYFLLDQMVLQTLIGAEGNPFFHTN